MIVSGLVIADGLLLDALLGHFQVNMNLPVGRRLGGENAQLHRIESGSGVPVGHVRQEFGGFFGDIRPVALHTPVGCESPVNQGQDVLPGQRLQFKDS